MWIEPKTVPYIQVRLVALKTCYILWDIIKAFMFRLSV